jgi:hypothetical protein
MNRWKFRLQCNCRGVWECFGSPDWWPDAFVFAEAESAAASLARCEAKAAAVYGRGETP